MKKKILLVAMVAGAANIFAQDLTSKKGEIILPEEKDYAISIEATPFLNFIGNSLNGATSNVAPTWNHLNVNNTIIGKMFKDATTAYRGMVRIGLNSSTQKALIGDASITTAPTYPAVPAMKEDVWKHSSTYVGLGGGLEMRRGKTRLQGYYGGDAFIFFSSTADKFEYGNTLTDVITIAPNTTNFGSTAANVGMNDIYGNAARVTERKNGSTIGIGVKGFVGCEYFILPKIAIGGEFGWGIGFSTTNGGSTTVESVNAAATSSQTLTTENGKSGSFGLDTSRDAFGTGSGALRATFHF